MNREDFQRCRRLAGLSVIGFAATLAPSVHAQDIDWFRFYGLPQWSLGVDAEGSTETTRVSGSNSTYDHLYVTPFIGLHSNGYIYHPNFLLFDLSGDFGWGWDNMTSSGGGASQTINESAQLLRYLAQFDFLSAKPYNGSIFAAQDHTYRDYGSFDTYTVDTKRYGARANWASSAFTLNADLGYQDESSTGLNDSSDITEMYLNFLGIYKRTFGQTTFNLHANDLENTVNSGAQMGTTSWSVGISDSETVGQRHQISESTGLSYSESTYSGQEMDTLNASENLLVNHRVNLSSYFIVNFNQSDLRSITDSTRVQATAGVRHQLYESLASNFDVHGSYQVDTASAGDSTSDIFGASLFESYSKKLQSWGRLTMGAGVTLDHQDQDSPQSTQTVFGEPHDLYLPTSSSYRPIFLSQPGVVDSSVIVSVPNDTLVPNVDYTLINSGQLTEIKLVFPASSHVQSLLQTNDVLSVTVTYVSASVNHAAYEQLNVSAQVRLDLFGHLGIYGRMNWLDNNAPPDVLTETLNDWIGGVDYNRKWFRTGAEYEDYDSTFTRYSALRFFQNFDFAFSDASTAGIDFNESFYNYAGNGDQSQYDFMAHYTLRLPLNFNWYVEGGAFWQKLSNTDQAQGMARTGFSWTRGKLSLRAGYEYNTQSTTTGIWTEDREKNLFFTYLRRTF